MAQAIDESMGYEIPVVASIDGYTLVAGANYKTTSSNVNHAGS